MEISFTSVVWTYGTFVNNFQIQHQFTKYLKESCRLGSEKHYSFKYFLKNTLVRKILLNLLGRFSVLQASMG